MRKGTRFPHRLLLICFQIEILGRRKTNTLTKANPTNHSYLTKQLHPKNTDYIKSLHHLMTIIPNNK